MGVSAVIGGAAVGLVGSAMQADAAQSAADTQAQAARDASQTQLQMFQTINQQQAPWRQAGVNALDLLNYGMGLPATSGTAPPPVAQTPIAQGVAQMGGGAGQALGPGVTQVAPGIIRREDNDGGFSYYNPATGETIGSSELALNNTGARQRLAQWMQQAAAQPAQATQPTSTAAQGASPATQAAQAAGITPGQLLQPLKPVDLNLPKLTNVPTQLPQYKPFTMADFQADPGYLFQKQQGKEAIENAAAAKGMLLSPNTMKELSAFTTGLADTTFNAAFGRNLQGQTTAYNEAAGAQQQAFNQALQGTQMGYNLANINRGNIENLLLAEAGLGQTATNQLQSAGLTTAGQVGTNIIGAGNAQAAGQVGAANAISGGVNNAVNQYLQYQQLQSILGGGGGGGTPNVMAGAPGVDQFAQWGLGDYSGGW